MLQDGLRNQTFVVSAKNTQNFIQKINFKYLKMDLKVRGKITKINNVQTGTSQKGEWKKVSFLLDNGAKYNNLFCFDILGHEKVDDFLKYNKEGKEVDVSFNVKLREYEGRYYTTLDAWKVFTAKELTSSDQQPDREDDMPF
jgi:hypothetical protein